MELAFKSILEIKELIDSWSISQKEVWDYFLERSEKLDSKLWSFQGFHKDWFSNSSEILSGIPIGIKDLFCETGKKTTWWSKILQDFTPPYSSSVIEKLNEAGMSSLWKLKMDEFAMGSSGENSAFWATKNPHGTNRIPGGSSSGSAAAVAAWLVPAALGTDTWGSLRQPASMCWVVGFRPGYGRNSRYWVMPMASSFDCPGTITQTVQDAALLYEVMNGEDTKESSSLPGKDIIDAKIWGTKDLTWIKVWVPKEYFEEWLDSWVRETVEKAISELKSLWAEIKEISLPMTKYAIAAYYIIVPAEVSTNLARLDGIRYGHNSDQPNESLEEIYLHNRGEGLGDEPKRRSILGSYVLSAWFYDAYYKKAAQVRTKIIEDFESAFQEVDLIVGPVSPSVAWKIWEKTEDPLKMYLADAYTVPGSLAGLPGMSIPCGFASSEDADSEKLPVGLQILGPRMWEQKIFELAYIYEQATWWREKMIPQQFSTL